MSYNTREIPRGYAAGLDGVTRPFGIEYVSGGPIHGIGVDIDEVTAKCSHKLAKEFSRRLNLKLTPEKESQLLHALNVMYWVSSEQTASHYGFTPKQWEDFKTFVFTTDYSPDFHQDLDHFPGTPQVVWELNSLAPVTYVTSRTDINCDSRLNGSGYRWVDKDGSNPPHNELDLRRVTEKWLIDNGFPNLPLVSLSRNTHIPLSSHPSKNEPAFQLGLNCIVDDKVITVEKYLEAALEQGIDAYGVVVEHPHNTGMRDGSVSSRRQTYEALKRFNCKGRVRAVHTSALKVPSVIAAWQMGILK